MLLGSGFGGPFAEFHLFRLIKSQWAYYPAALAGLSLLFTPHCYCGLLSAGQQGEHYGQSKKGALGLRDEAAGSPIT